MQQQSPHWLEQGQQQQQQQQQQQEQPYWLEQNQPQQQQQQEEQVKEKLTRIKDEDNEESGRLTNCAVKELTTDYCPHVAVSCFVFWCCNVLAGFTAFVLAVCAREKEGEGEKTKARTLALASVGVSIAGLALGLIVIVTILCVELISGV